MPDEAGIETFVPGLAAFVLEEVDPGNQAGGGEPPGVAGAVGFPPGGAAGLLIPVGGGTVEGAAFPGPVDVGRGAEYGDAGLFGGGCGDGYGDAGLFGGGVTPVDAAGGAIDVGGGEAMGEGAAAPGGV